MANTMRFEEIRNLGMKFEEFVNGPLDYYEVTEEENDIRFFNYEEELPF